MSDAPERGDQPELGSVLERIKSQAANERLRFTRHAHEEKVEEGISLTEVLEAIQTSMILEDFPEHRRGACCLLGGSSSSGRPLHLVCTTAQRVLVVITAYEPKLPKWMTPTRRGTRP